MDRRGDRERPCIPVGREDIRENSLGQVLQRTAGRSCIVWDIGTRKEVQTLNPNEFELEFGTPKFSPQDGRIATAADNCVRIWDSNNGRLIRHIRVKLIKFYGLLWQSNGHLLAVSTFNDDTSEAFRHAKMFYQIDASTGTILAKWTVPDRDYHWGKVATPKHGEFIAYTIGHTVTILDASTRTQLGLIQHSQDIASIALSPDGRFLAIGERGASGKIVIKNLSCFTYAGVPLPRIYPLPSFQEPDIRVDDAALALWEYDQLADTEALLTTAIATPQNTSHHALVGRALVRARLRQWDAALDDAEKSIKIQLSIIGYIAKSVALVGKGEKHKAYRTCDILFHHFLPSAGSLTFLLLIKAIVVFMAGDHDDAISRVDDLIAMVHDNSKYYVVQVYMYLLVGKLRMESRHYEGAIRSFERARAQMRAHTTQEFLVISLITGWKFDDLGIRIRRHLCEAQYAASCAKCQSRKLMISAPQFNKIYVKPYMRPVVASKQASLFSR
ncbi:YVTN repeat-like/Quino protein amine dehydrogenase [Imleria badia]|nr:YVTN repeat-like/Quino protein amine dehydrogenase [Imleria badia]